jgi:hypothetical protein
MRLQFLQTTGANRRVYLPSEPPQSDRSTAMCTITGTGFTSTYEMPVAGYYDQKGNLLAQATATVIAMGPTSKRQT